MYMRYADRLLSCWLAGSLTRLDLSINVHQHLQDGHLQHIAKLQTLSVLDISGVGDQLTDRGLLALTALTSLSFLHLADITSADVSLEVLPTRGRKGVRTAPGDALLLQTKFGKVRAHCNTDGSGLKCQACWEWRLHCCLRVSCSARLLAGVMPAERRNFVDCVLCTCQNPERHCRHQLVANSQQHATWKCCGVCGVWLVNFLLSAAFNTKFQGYLVKRHRVCCCSMATWLPVCPSS